MTNFEKLKAEIQEMNIEQFINMVKKIAYFDCEFCKYNNDKATCLSGIPCSLGITHWLKSEVEE